jgi:hypothetical protein
MGKAFERRWFAVLKALITGQQSKIQSRGAAQNLWQCAVGVSRKSIKSRGACFAQICRDPQWRGTLNRPRLRR